MRSILVVFCLPLLQVPSKIFVMPELPSAIELLRVCLVTLRNLAVHLWASGRDVAVRNTEISKVSSELWSQRRVVIRLDCLDGERKMLTNSPLEVDGSLGVVVVGDGQNTKPRTHTRVGC